MYGLLKSKFLQMTLTLVLNGLINFKECRKCIKDLYPYPLKLDRSFCEFKF